MSVTLSEIAKLVDGKLTGDPAVVITHVAPLHLAEPGTLTFINSLNKTEKLLSCQATAVIAPVGFQSKQFCVIEVMNPQAAFEKAAAYFRPIRNDLIDGISSHADIHPTAKIGKNVNIGSGVVIGAEVEIGDDCMIHAGTVIMAGTKIGRSTLIFPNVVLYENTVIGKYCILHANSVLGAYGFGYDSSKGVHVLSVQYGNVVLEDWVEVGACTTIDRGTYDSTTIGEGTKIDNQVMIAHNCRIGRYNMICASTGIAGSTTTGDYVVMAGRVGVRDHVQIGDMAVLGAMAGIMADVPKGARVVGIPATPEKEQMRKQVALAKLPEMRKEMRELQKTVQNLVRQIKPLSQSQES